MSYCTQSDIEKQIPEEILIELTDDDGAGVVDTDAVDRAIADADEEIDAFVSMQYGLPFESTPGLIRRMSVNLAICNLYARRPHLDIPESRKDRCSADRKLLEQVAKGTLKLDEPDPTKDADGGVETTRSKSDRIFSIGRGSDSSTGTLDNY
ncbi:MAG: DUF1320 domain-containing protein [Desulfobacterales bacterium]|nr:DUF1320 domain-containing protein [Desulfobacterales bacterium]